MEDFTDIKSLSTVETNKLAMEADLKAAIPEKQKKISVEKPTGNTLDSLEKLTMKNINYLEEQQVKEITDEIGEANILKPIELIGDAQISTEQIHVNLAEQQVKEVTDEIGEANILKPIELTGDAQISTEQIHVNLAEQQVKEVTDEIGEANILKPIELTGDAQISTEQIHVNLVEQAFIEIESETAKPSHIISEQPKKKEISGAVNENNILLEQPPKKIIERSTEEESFKSVQQPVEFNNSTKVNCPDHIESSEVIPPISDLAEKLNVSNLQEMDDATIISIEKPIVCTQQQSTQIANNTAVELKREGNLDVNLSDKTSEDLALITCLQDAEKNTIVSQAETNEMPVIYKVDQPNKGSHIFTSVKSVIDKTVSTDQIECKSNCTKKESPDLQLVSETKLYEDQNLDTVQHLVTNSNIPSVEEAIASCGNVEENESVKNFNQSQPNPLDLNPKIEKCEISAFSSDSISSVSQSLLEGNDSDTSALMKLAELACRNEMADLNLQNVTPSDMPTVETSAMSSVNYNEDTNSFMKENMTYNSEFDVNSGTNELKLDDIEKHAIAVNNNELTEIRVPLAFKDGSRFNNSSLEQDNETCSKINLELKLDDTEKHITPMNNEELTKSKVQLPFKDGSRSNNSSLEQDYETCSKLPHEQEKSAETKELSKEQGSNYGISVVRENEPRNKMQTLKMPEDDNSTSYNQANCMNQAEIVEPSGKSNSLEKNTIGSNNHDDNIHDMCQDEPNNLISGKDTFPDDEMPVINYICKRCRKLWKDKLLKLLFEGTEPLTVKSSITYGAILCMRIYALKNNLPVNDAVKSVLDSANFGDKLEQYSIDMICKFIQKLICYKKIKCCDAFCPINSLKCNYFSKANAKNVKNIASTKAVDDNQSSTDSIISSKYAGDCHKLMAGENSNTLNSENVLSTKKDIDVVEMVSQSKISVELCKNSKKQCSNLALDSIHRYFNIITPFVTQNSYYIKKGIPAIKAYLLKEKQCLPGYLKVPYNSLYYNKEYLTEIDGIYNRTMSFYELVSCCVICYDIDEHVYDKKMLYTLLSCLLRFRNSILLIPDGEAIVSYVTRITTEKLLAENQPDEVWDEDEIYSVTINQELTVSTIRDVIVVLCLQRQGVESKISLLNCLKARGVQDIVGYSVNVYATYCDIAFRQQEESKARFLLNLRATSNNADYTVSANLNIFPPQSSSSHLGDYIDFYRNKLSSKFTNDMLCKENQNILLEETSKCKYEIIKFAQDKSLQTGLLAHVKETSRNIKSKRKVYEKSDFARPSKMSKPDKTNQQLLKDVVANLLEEDIKPDALTQIVEIVYRDVYKKEIPSLTDIQAVLCSSYSV